MKIAFALAAFVAAQDDVVPDDVWQGEGAENQRGLNPRGLGGDDDRRYDDLKNMARKLWAKNGFTGRNKFDERKYWAYGCHCFILGDRPMTEMGWGRPVDTLDFKCKAYKDCQKCVREKHGDDCIGEAVRYQWRWASRSNDFESRDPAGSCKRELFECDAQFVKDQFAEKDVFSNDYHAFWTTTGFDREEKDQYCPSSGGNPVEKQCCGGHDGPWYWIGLNSQKCCAQGEGGVVRPVGDAC